MRKILFILICLIFNAQATLAQIETQAPKELKVIILPDNLQLPINNFLVYPEAAELLSVDISNNLKKQKVAVPSVSMLRNDLNKNTRLKVTSATLMESFKKTYNVDYVALKKIADNFGVDKAILITSNLDVQNYFLRRTLWDFLNIPGATVIDPAHKLTTHVVLIDTTNETVLWSNTYEKMLKRFESRTVTMDFNSTPDKINAMKLHYSIIAPTISYNVMTKIDPNFEATVNAIITNSEANPEATQETETPMKTEPIVPSIDENIKPVSQIKPTEKKLPVVEQKAVEIVKPVVVTPKIEIPNPADPVFSGLKKPELRK